MKKEMIFGIFALFAAMLVLTACQPTGKATTYIFCNDTDGGKQPNIAGKIVLYDQNNQIIKADNCISSSKVLEWYCNTTQPLNETITCQTNYICSDNACKSKLATQAIKD